MSVGRKWIGCAVLSLVALVACPALAAPKWLCAQSPHFELYSSSDRDSVERLANALETMADILGRAGLGRRTTARPVTVIIGFPDKRSLTPHLPVADGRHANFAGYVVHNPYGNWIGYGEFDDRGRMVAQHEYAHTIVNQVFRHLPLTLNEGFADYLSTFSATDEMAEFGHPIPWHRYAIQANTLRPLDEMFQIDGRAVDRMSNDEQELFYAESWVFVHYLLRADVTGGRFTQFMRAAAEGEPVRSAFARYYPDEAWDKLPSRLRGYVETEVYSVHQIALKGLDLHPAVPIRPASNAEVQAEIGIWRLYESTVDTADTRQILEAALAQGPEGGVARAGLGELMRRGKRRDAALGYFRDVSRDQGAAPRALTISGAGMLEIGGETADAGIITEARAMLARSVAKDSLDAAALGFFGRASLASDRADAAAISALEKATTAMPGDEDLASAYSVALAHTGHVSEAREAAQQSQALTRDPSARSLTLQGIDQVALRDSVEKLLSGGDPTAALALMDRRIASTSDAHERSDLQSVRADIAAMSTEQNAYAEYKAGIDAARQENAAEAKTHFEAAQRATNDPTLRDAAARAVANLDSVLANEGARSTFDRAVKAWNAGDYHGAKARFDSVQVLTTSADVRDAARDGSANASAVLEIQRGLGAVRKSAWSDAIAAFQHAASLARTPDLKSRAEQMLADAKKQAAAGGTPAGHK